ncbi:MAG TPA: hypothetical protein VK474_02120 [Chthoniobacterales bacterium]|nr:hypothetical protein [Chthoniobacterales bacterium]
MRAFLATTLFLFLLVPQFLEAKDPPPPPAKSFAAFWKEFQSAVVRNDPEAVVALSDVPLFYQNGKFSKAALLKEYPSTFTPAVRKCLAAAKPVRDRDSYVVFCGEEIFSFGKVNGAYKFTDIGMND